MFVNLNHTVLHDLQSQGYNVLKSTSEWGDKSPTFRPARVEDVNDYLIRMQQQGKMTGNEHFLVINEALTIPEDELFGVVLMD